MDYAGVASKIVDLLKKGEKNNLVSVMIKDTGQEYYFDLATNQYILIKKQAEMYYLPLTKSDDGKCYVFLPYVFASGAIILVPEDDLLFIGHN
jgi:hypothetical protein